MVAVISVARTVATKRTLDPWLFLISVMIATVSVLMIAHASEVFVWALAYALVNAAPSSADLVYFAFVNYTTLGYGDIIPVELWRLIGPMTAMNGVLLFGWSTAVIFEVLRRALMKIDILSGSDQSWSSAGAVVMPFPPVYFAGMIGRAGHRDVVRLQRA
jgi:hypothetical protein